MHLEYTPRLSCLRRSSFQIPLDEPLLKCYHRISFWGRGMKRGSENPFYVTAARYVDIDIFSHARCTLSTSRMCKTRKLYTVVSRTRKCVSVGLLFNIVAFNIDVYIMHTTKLHEMVEGFALLKFREVFSKILRLLCTLFASENLQKKKNVIAIERASIIRK